MLYRNTNEKFGDVGPFEAESKEALALDFNDQLSIWAMEWVQEQLDAGVEFAEDETPDHDKFVELRDEFIAGLVEVNE